MPRSLFAPALLALCLALAACSFPEGPQWPALAEPDALQPQPGEWAGPPADPLAGRPNLAPLAVGAPAPGARDPASLVGLVRPLMVIRFPGTKPDFEMALYDTLRRALELRPSTAFDLVAVAPAVDAPDETVLLRNVRTVVRALSEMGLPEERLSLSATTAQGIAVQEVHFYVR